MNIHPSISVDEIENAVRESLFGMDNPGFCNACGAGADGVEPDAQNYECECCGAHEVYGAEIFMALFC